MKPRVPKQISRHDELFSSGTPFPLIFAMVPPHFSVFVDSVLAGFTFECCLLYLDDVIVYSKAFEQHMDALDKIFIALRDVGLRLNVSKFSFGVSRVMYLGPIISKNRDRG
jgi:hypothetical protein